jgi:hypothetical protein
MRDLVYQVVRRAMSIGMNIAVAALMDFAQNYSDRHNVRKLGSEFHGTKRKVTKLR